MRFPIYLLFLSFVLCRLPFIRRSGGPCWRDCISGKVFKVEEGNKGVRYLDFCADYASCPSTVVVFPSVLRYVGDVTHLANTQVEVHGSIKLYDGRAEIILRDARQLRGKAAKIRRFPKVMMSRKRDTTAQANLATHKPRADQPRNGKNRRYLQNSGVDQTNPRFNSSNA